MVARASDPLSVGAVTEETVRLGAPGGEGLRAEFAPAANMVLHSLTLGGRELLAQRNGLEAYRERGSTMGVPLLHPWANRLAGPGYLAAGTEVAFDPESELFKRDPHGLPIHGVLPSLLRWDVLDREEASLVAGLEWGRSHPAFELFPFPHRLRYEARLGPRTLEIAVALEPAEDVPVPVSFGFHPYLRIPGGERATAEMYLPVRRALLHDASMIPTGESSPTDPGLRRLGSSEWDDGFADLTSPPRFVLSSDGSEVALTFMRGYHFAQVFAPPGSDFVCFEPMTAPTNALGSGADLPVVAPGGRYETAFAISAWLESSRWGDARTRRPADTYDA
jgi:galactose mutarotase-like enzyme